MCLTVLNIIQMAPGKDLEVISQDVYELIIEILLIFLLICFFFSGDTMSQFYTCRGSLALMTCSQL